MDQEQVRRAVEKIISEELTRITQEVIAGLGRFGGPVADCGCLSKEGCCEQQGCCEKQGCCAKGTSLIEMVDERIDILEEFILSHKEPIAKFFKARGVELGF